MFPKLVLAYIFSISITLCFGQLPKIETKEDALKALKQNLSDSNRQFIYNFLGVFYMSNTSHDKSLIDSAFYCLRKAVYLGDSINRDNKDITNESLSLLAKAYLWSGNASAAKRIFLQVISNYHTRHQKINEAKAWRRMGKEFWYSDIRYLEITNYFDSAIVLFNQQKLTIESAQAMFDKMNFFSTIGNNVAAEEVLQQLIKLAKADHFENFSHIYALLARQNRYTGNLNKALEYALEAINHIDYLKDKSGVANFYGELAEIYEELGETGQSITWYKKCIAERERNGTSLYVIYRTVSLMVVQMIKAKEENEALALLRQLLKDKPPVTHAEKAILAQSFAYCYSALKEYKLAEPKFLEMINEYDQGEIQQEILFLAHYDITKFYVDINQYTKARFYLDKIPSVGASIRQNKDLYLLMFKIDSANGKLASAINYYQKYKALNDTIFNEAKSKQVNELMIKYESEKKDNNIKTLEKESVAQHERLVQANQTRNWILGVAILLFIITGLFINNSRIRQQANKKLQLQQKEIQGKNKSLQHLLKEKDWLVKEIHHRVKNNLHTIIGLLHTQSGFLKSEEALLAINDSQHRIQTMSLIHEKLFQSADLSTIEMSGYIYELVDYLKHSFDTGQNIQFKLDTEELELKLSHALPLGLILNEAITNAIKYAFPANRSGVITVSFKNIAGLQYLLTIADNGIGLPEGFDFKKSSSMGMNLMEGLSEDIQGNFSIKNNNGTAINILFLYDPSIADEKVIQQDGSSPETI
ncbi:tetratricopeptide repeat-containing sensor histidine kinase [Ferruginibacter profundus]